MVYFDFGITMGREFKFSAQECNLAPFVGNGTKVKIPSEIKRPLDKMAKNSKAFHFDHMY